MRNINIRTVFASAMVAVMLLFSLLGVALAAVPTADASRTIDPQVVEPGEDVEVTVVFENVAGTDKAFALNETVPDGWGFTPGSTDGGMLKDINYPSIEWFWMVVEDGATKTVTYTLTVPVDEEAGNYTIEGTVTSVNPETMNPVGGDTTITVMEEVPPVPVEYDLTISSSAGGEVTEPGEGTFPYDEGTPVGLVATAIEGYEFVNWTGDVGTMTNANAAATTITMNDDYSITANFEAEDTEPPTPPSPFCFIATAAYGSPTAEQLDVLREFRDVVLLKSALGSEFVSLYYQLSPPIADFIAGNELLRTVVRELLIDPIVWMVEATGDMWCS